MGSDEKPPVRGEIRKINGVDYVWVGLGWVPYDDIAKGIDWRVPSAGGKQG